MTRPPARTTKAGGAARLLLDVPDEPTLEEAEAGLRRALRDPTLTLAAWDATREQYVDADGRAAELPADTGSRVTTRIEYEGRPLAVLIHDAALRRDEPELLEEVVATARVALEKDRTVRALRASESRGGALLAAIPDNMFRVTRDGGYVDANVKDERYLPVPLAELPHMNVREILPGPVADLVLDAVAVALETGEVQTVEYRMQRPIGVRDSEARVVASGKDEVVIIVRDITERKQADAELKRLHDELEVRAEELRLERDLLSTVVDTAPALFCGVDPSGRVVRYNRALQELSGLTEDRSPRGQLFWEAFVVPEEWESFEQRFRMATREGPNADHENKWLRGSGEPAVVVWSAAWYPGEDGEDRFLISGSDITQRYRQEEEIRKSRARLVEAGDLERRRLERNLHDGAQQRLISLSLSLRRARAKLKSDADAAEQILAEAGSELTVALEELRELARGIHPAVLTDRGLGPALESLVDRAPIRVELEQLPDDRLPGPVEAAAFYVVSEALTNVAKYAQASSAKVRVERREGVALVEVADDGVGGADPLRGTGLRGLADRVEALEGRLEVDSAPGRGTVVRAEIPVA